MFHSHSIPAPPRDSSLFPGIPRSSKNFPTRHSIHVEHFLYTPSFFHKPSRHSFDTSPTESFPELTSAISNAHRLSSQRGEQ